MSTLQVVTAQITTLSDGSNSTSCTNAILGSAKAWVNFDGTLSGPTISPRSSYNVTSITKNGTGNYTLNFASGTFSDNLYSIVATAGPFQNSGSNCYIGFGSTAGTANSSPNIRTSYLTGGNIPFIDLSLINIVVFR